MWRVVVTTEADGPEPSVKVATVASTVVPTETCSPLETVLVASAQSDHVWETLGVGLATASTGEPSLDLVGLIVMSAVELSLEGTTELQSPQLAVCSALDEEVVLAPTTSFLVVVEAESLPSTEMVDEVVVTLSTVDSLELVDDSQSSQDSVPFIV